MKFRTVYEHSNWGSLFYNFKRKSGSFTDDPCLKAGKEIWVNFKSGKTFLHKIVEIPHTDFVDSNRYEVHTSILGINIEHEGHVLFMSLKGLKVSPL